MRIALWGDYPMNSSCAFFAPVNRGFRRPIFSMFSVLMATCALTASVWAQAEAGADANGNGNARGRRGGGQNGQNGQNADGTRGGRGNFNPQEMQERQLTMLREQFGVTDDAEWGIIAQKITKVSELRRTAGPGGMMAGGRGGFGGGGGGGRGRGTGNPELDQLRSAVNDKLPDAEIKARLERLREARKNETAKLEQAQEELRAVLSVRQEAFAVMMGLLP